MDGLTRCACLYFYVLLLGSCFPCAYTQIGTSFPSHYISLSTPEYGEISPLMTSLCLRGREYGKNFLSLHLSVYARVQRNFSSNSIILCTRWSGNLFPSHHSL